MMLQNFSSAKYTVILDLDLINTPWTDSGAAAVAITLSTRTTLFRDKSPMTARVAWSWCPPSLFDLDNLGYSVAPIPAADIQDNERVPRTSLRRDGLVVLLRDSCKTGEPGQAAALQLPLCRVGQDRRRPRDPGDMSALKVNQPPDGSHVTPGFLVQPVDRRSKARRRRAEAGKVAAHGMADDPWAKAQDVNAQLRKARDGRPLRFVMLEELTLFCRYVGCVFLPFPTKIEAPLSKCLIGEDADEHGFPLSVVNAEYEIRNIVRQALAPRT
ncbi:hypothetical protein DL771_002388 [Monosporascus sp. 5C6A]|nr:hypothetical protein DL771_002388 [Monosporascus sp. 5C6A]